MKRQNQSMHSKQKSNLPVDNRRSLLYIGRLYLIAGWSSLVARRAHNPKVAGSNPAPATT